ncbi:MAG: RecX family transcriptional regulator [Tissierellia bacterium]|nr:RecX family transcriptional regulator [Tissierellia bacterium]
MKTIDKITFHPKEKSYDVIFKDGTTIPVEEDTLVQYNLYKGKEIEEQEISQILNYNEFSQGKEIALKYLVNRRTSREIKIKLQHEGISHEVIQNIIDKLIDLHLLNDHLYASDFIKDKIHLKSDGPIKIKYLLEQKGIESSISDPLLEQIDEDVWLNMAKNILIKKFKERKSHNSKEYQKMFRYLYGKGYPTHIVYKVLKDE